MAINIELIQSSGFNSQPGGSRGSAIVLPAESITNLTAAGETVLNAVAKVFMIRNRTGGDAVYALIRPLGSTDAAAANGIHLTAGQSITFAIPKNTLGTAYELDLAAV